MAEDLQKALTAVELREAELLSWGAVGAEWLHHELIGPSNRMVRLISEPRALTPSRNGIRPNSAVKDASTAVQHCQTSPT